MLVSPTISNPLIAVIHNVAEEKGEVTEDTLD
jgi:hypothetical protein